MSTPQTQHVRLTWDDPSTGDPHERTYPLPVTFGRGNDNTVVLNSRRVSRHHTRLERDGEQVVAVDAGSTNGTYLNERRISRAPVQSGDALQIGPFAITVDLAPFRYQSAPDRAPDTGKATLLFDETSDKLLPFAPAPAGTPTFPPPPFDRPIVSVSALRRASPDLAETTYLAVGGGLGSFAWVDHLRVFGVSPEQIAVVGLEESPHGRYRRLCRFSQIPDHERLRSDSGSTPDNLWGWPGYALREIWRSLLRAELGNATRVAWQIFGEPTLAQTYTPRAGDVYAAIEGEMARIGWRRMWQFGHVKAIRKTDDGRYAVAYTQTTAAGRAHKLLLAPYVHVAVGYPGVRFLPDLQRYRQETGDFKTVVNAYENHEHVYARLARSGGVVMVRGRGIVASRIIQRLYEVRQESGAEIAILHLLRSPLAEGNRYDGAQRAVANHWEFQPFNWPKACWGGDLRLLLERSRPEERDRLLNDWGGTTTADRRDWRRMVREGIRQGWYQIRFGSVDRVQRNDAGKLETIIRGKGAIADQAHLVTDFILDCTGLEASIDTNPLLHDLIDHHHLGRNPKGRLAVTPNFVVKGMENSRGRLFASGAMTLGGPYAPVDSFLGLQFTALRITDTLADLGAPGVRRLNGLRSAWQWLRWARGVAP